MTRTDFYANLTIEKIENSVLLSKSIKRYNQNNSIILLMYSRTFLCYTVVR